MSDDQDQTAPKTPVEQAVETLVYAPIGLLFEGASLLPELVEKGRSQVTMARMIGQFAVQQGREEARKAAGRLQDQAAGVLDLIGGASPSPATTNGDMEPEPAPRATRPTRTAPRSPGAAREAARKVAGAAAPVDGAAPQVAPASAPPSPAGRAPTAPATGAQPTTSPEPATLAIPDYDGLSASHVVNRLAGLSAAELEAVRAYEAANRGRKTILSKVAQLQSS